MLEEITGRKMKIESMADSTIDFNEVAKDGETTERQLQIDIFTLRQTYEDGKLYRIGWIPGK